MIKDLTKGYYLCQCKKSELASEIKKLVTCDCLSLVNVWQESNASSRFYDLHQEVRVKKKNKTEDNGDRVKHSGTFSISWQIITLE